MPQSTNLNKYPYFDDFDSNKDFYKVLFKPGTTVQARELTTLQSILQNQIEKFGTACPLSNKKVIEKKKQTLLDRYGTDIIAHIPGSQQKIRKHYEILFILLLHHVFTFNFYFSP